MESINILQAGRDIECYALQPDYILVLNPWLILFFQFLFAFSVHGLLNSIIKVHDTSCLWVIILHLLFFEGGRKGEKGQSGGGGALPDQGPFFPQRH